MLRCYCWLCWWWWFCFNIRSFGSWIASCTRIAQPSRHLRFNIRSFGSWIASTNVDLLLDPAGTFQYPLFRIVDCFPQCYLSPRTNYVVSISALSDRGLLQSNMCWSTATTLSFNIRSFGSWIASLREMRQSEQKPVFQYPLFRIVDCFNSYLPWKRQVELYS